MKLTAEQITLAKALAKVAGIIEKRNTIPILANILLRANADNTATIIGTDLDIEVITTLECTTEQPGETTVNAQLFTDIVKKTPPGKLISLDLSGDKLAVKSGRSKFNLATLPAYDMPQLGNSEFTHSFDIAGPELARLIGKPAFAMSTEETRYYLNGVYLHVADDKITAVATDGHRLARCVSDMAADIPGVIIPRKTVSEARKVLSSGAVTVSVSDSKIRMDMGDTVITSKVVDGTFPDYTRIIPSTQPNSVTIDAKELARAADRVASLVEDRTKVVSVKADGGALTIAAKGGLGTAEDTIDASILGDGVTFHINSTYMRETLSQAEGGDVVIEYNDPMSPVVMKAKEDSNFMAIIMPTRG
jgi:DNA polymerase III subunit beta